MRRLVSLLTVIFIMSVAVVPAYAFDWPPKNYDMPRTVITGDTASYMLSGVKSSMRAISNVSLKIMGIIISFSLISYLFNSLVLEKLRMWDAVRKKERGRAVNQFDRALNYDGIVQDRVEKMALGLDAKAAFTGQYLDAIIAERKLNLKVNRLDRHVNFDDIVQDRVEQMEVNHAARWIFMQQYKDDLVEERMMQMEINSEARRRFGTRRRRARVDLRQRMYESEQAYSPDE